MKKQAGPPGLPVRKQDLFADRYARRRHQLSPSLLKVASFIDANRMAVLTSSAVELAREAGTSDATVVRAVQALGFEGLHDLRETLASSFGMGTAPVDNLQRTLAETSEDTGAAIDAVLDGFASGLEALRAPGLRRKITAAIGTLHAARRVVVFGIGPTAHIAHYFAARLRRKGKPQAVLDRTGTELADQLLELGSGDALLILAYGRSYMEADLATIEARRLGLPIVLITDSEKTALCERASVVLVVPRGLRERSALHASTVACLEMLLLGLATIAAPQAVASLAELERLRQSTRTQRRRMRDDKDTDEQW